MKASRRSPPLRERVASVGLKDKSKVFNTARIEALEVDNLIEAAQATMVSAAARKECRGAHTVYDYEHPPTTRSSRWAATTEWMKHTLWHSGRQPPGPTSPSTSTPDGGPCRPKVRTF